MQILRPCTKFSESEWLLNTSAWGLWYEGHCAGHDQRDFHMKMLTSLTSRYVTKLFSFSQCQDGFESKQSLSTITKDNYFSLGPALLYCLSLKEHNILKRIIISSFMCSKKNVGQVLWSLKRPGLFCAAVHRWVLLLGTYTQANNLPRFLFLLFTTIQLTGRYAVCRLHIYHSFGMDSE